MRTPIRVVIVGGPPGNTGRQLARVLEADGDITVLCETLPSDAAAMIKRLNPDVAVVRLPDDGIADDPESVSVIDAIKHISATHPTPMLVIEGLNGRRGIAMAARVAGAVDVIGNAALAANASETRTRLRVLTKLSLGDRRRRRGHGDTAPSVPVVGIGASLGGPAALAEVLGQLDGLPAAVLIVQHMQAASMTDFIDWMRRASRLPIALAEDGVMPRPAAVFIAPANLHLRIGVSGRLSLGAEPPSIHRPSINELFTSMAKQLGRSAVGVILTGMGDDGVVGLLQLHQAGAMTIAQDEASSRIYGMPRAAQRAGAVRTVLPLSNIADAITRAVTRIGA